MSHILIFGDSIAQGYWDEEGGWIARLRKFIDERSIHSKNYDCLIFNLGVSGDTTEDLLQRFEFETEQRSKENGKTIFIFAIGGNDSQFYNDKKSLHVAPEKFSANIQKLIKLARRFSQKIIFIGPTPVDEPLVDPIPWAKEKSYKNIYIKKYNEIIKNVSKKEKSSFIELFENWIKIDYKKLLEDGAHPNSEGHEKIFETVKDFLIKNELI